MYLYHIHQNNKFRLVAANQIILSTIGNEGFDSPVKVHGARKASLFYLLVINFKVKSLAFTQMKTGQYRHDLPEFIIAGVTTEVLANHF